MISYFFNHRKLPQISTIFIHLQDRTEIYHHTWPGVSCSTGLNCEQQCGAAVPNQGVPDPTKGRGMIVDCCTDLDLFFIVFVGLLCAPCGSFPKWSVRLQFPWICACFTLSLNEHDSRDTSMLDTRWLISNGQQDQMTFQFITSRLKTCYV